MRIVCPSCQAAYEVPESLVATGKAVRCARCGTEWVTRPAEPPPASGPPEPAPPPIEVPPPPPPSPIAAPPPPEPMPMPKPGSGPGAMPGPDLRAEPRLPGYRPRSIDTEDDDRPPPRDDEIEEPRRRRGALVAWVVSLLLLALLIWAAFAFRGHVMGAWPPSTRLYATLGLR